MVIDINVGHADELTFAALRRANRARLPLFKDKQGKLAHSKPDGSDWSIAEWTNAIAGETGEACNLAKKIRRGDFGLKGSDEYEEAVDELAKEFADIVIYVDLAAQQIQADLGYAVMLKFNEVSDRVGADVKLQQVVVD